MLKSLDRMYPQNFMTDAVIFGNQNGDKNASLQFGVAISTIQYWRRKFPKLPAKPQYQLIKNPLQEEEEQEEKSQTMKVEDTVCDKTSLIKEGDDKKVLADWLIERMDENEFPSINQIMRKSVELKIPKPFRAKHQVTKFMISRDLNHRWRTGAADRIRKFASHSRKYKPLKKKNPQKPEADAQKLENVLSLWVNRKLNCKQRPTLSKIHNKYHELASQHNVKVQRHKFPKNFGDAFLRKRGFRKRWENLLHRTDNKQRSGGNVKVKFVRNQSKMGYTNPLMKETILKDEASKLAKTTCIESSSKKTKVSVKESFLKTFQSSSAKFSGAAAINLVEDNLLQWMKTEYPDGARPDLNSVVSKASEIVNEFNITNVKPTHRWCQSFLDVRFGFVDDDGAETSSTHLLDLSKGQIPSTTSACDIDQIATTSGIQIGCHGNRGINDIEEAAHSGFRDDNKADPMQTVTSVFMETDIKSTVANFLSPVTDLVETESIFGLNLTQSPKKQKIANSLNLGVVVKRDFGSFHTSNLNEQLRFAESASYVPAKLPVRVPMFEEYTILECKFGSTVRKKHFFLEQGCIFLNHGAFGGALKEALDYCHDWQRYLESQPLRFFDRLLFPQIVHVQKRLANFVGCKASEITFTTNVTTAINAVLQGLPLNKNSSIYYLSLTYGAVKKIIKHVCARTGAQAIEVTVILPISKPEDIVSLVRSTLNSTTTLAIFDHVPSNYGFIMPVRELVSICHQRGVQVLIDGAHGLGQLHLDLSILGADYYAGNCHKWFCSPKGCAFMYVNKQLQRLTRGLIISHGYDDGFHSQFMWTGAKDYCAYLSLHALINFWTTVGPNKIRDYCKSLLKEVTDYFMLKWDAELLAPIECHGMMCCISLPSVLFYGKEISYDDAEAIQNRLYFDFNIEVPIKCIENKLYVRISAHIYNEFSEYATLASAILQIANTA